MKRWVALTDCALILLTILLVNGAALGEAVFYGRQDSALIESMSGEDEMRYIGKMREAYEGRWLMSDPYLKEHRDESFSASGFLEWIPAALLRLTGGKTGFVLLFTDLLFTALTIILTFFWLRRIIPSRIVVWCCMTLLFSTVFGGSLDGLLRDTVPKFVQPLMSLYLLLLTFPNRGTLKSTLLRGILIGCMFYTYPYHWSVCLMTEATFVLYQLWQHLYIKHEAQMNALRGAIMQGAVVLIPFALIAAPMAIAMKRMLSKPEFADFYGRYHLVYTHLPAAPKLQVIVLCAIAILIVYIVRGTKHHRMTALHELLPLLLPLGGMMILLNANVITGKDPELLGHGGRVIMPVVTVAYAAVVARLCPKHVTHVIGSMVLGACLIFAGQQTAVRWQHLHSTIIQWNAAPEEAVLEWMNTHLPPERIIAAPRSISEKIPMLTSHYVFFAAGAHFSFVSLDELTDRYLGWVGLYPQEKELTDTATVIIFGNHPGAQWSKERTWNRLIGQPFTKTMADYIERQDLRQQIDTEHAHPDNAKTVERLRRYNADVIVVPEEDHLSAAALAGFSQKTVIGPYAVWVHRDVSLVP